MIITKFTLFENFNEKEKADIISFFQDIFDLEHDYFQVRSIDTKNVLEKRYQKVIKHNYSVSSAGNFVIQIWCDFSFAWSIENEIKTDIVPRLKFLEYKTIIRNVATSEKVYKVLPTSSGGTTIMGDSIHLITVTIKKTY